jgi:hypothetical protein
MECGGLTIQTTMALKRHDRRNVLTTLPGDHVTLCDKTDRETNQSVVQIFQYMSVL